MILSPRSGGVLEAGRTENWHDHLSGGTTASELMADVYDERIGDQAEEGGGCTEIEGIPRAL